MFRNSLNDVCRRRGVRSRQRPVHANECQFSWTFGKDCPKSASTWKAVRESPSTNSVFERLYQAALQQASSFALGFTV